MANRGRPKKPSEERKAGRLDLRITDGDKETFQAAADAAGKPLSAWMRDRLLEAANQELGRTA